MSRVVTEATLPASALAGVLEPREGFVAERRDGPQGFIAGEGPFWEYTRRVGVEAAGDGQVRVRQVVEFRLAIPWFGWIFALPARRLLGRLDGGPASPWWAPPDRLDARATSALAVLCALSAVTVYCGILFSQTLTFAATEFGASRSAQGVAGAFVRADFLLALAIVARADRRGRRGVAVGAAAAGCSLTAFGALAPTLGWLAATQVLARGCLSATGILIGIMAAEEMPAGSRAFALGLLAMGGGIGGGGALALLPLADAGTRGWRLPFLAALGLLPL
ncbi:MAG: hypothetical protein ACRD0D_10225, partial [Acidimicrobiales bacterium]